MKVGVNVVIPENTWGHSLAVWRGLAYNISNETRRAYGCVSIYA